MFWREAGEIGGRILSGCIVAGALAGCSFNMAEKSSEPVAATGSIRPATYSTLSSDLGQEDWRRAKGALAIALDPQGSGAPVKWDNPDTKVGGTFTPVSQPYVKSNDICRAFLAAVTYPERKTSFQGTACRLSAEDWEIRDLRPWSAPA